MSVERYVVCDEAAQHIVAGPYLWDGVTSWVPPREGTVLLEAEAVERGYTHPPEEHPADPPAEPFDDKDR